MLFRSPVRVHGALVDIDEESGKALSPLREGVGMVDVLITLQ